MIDKEKSLDIRAHIRQTLMSKWDPIGVSAEPNAVDEYDSYLGDVYALLERRATDREISCHLQDVETRRMGLVDGNGKPLVPAIHRAEAVSALQLLSSLFPF